MPSFVVDMVFKPTDRGVLGFFSRLGRQIKISARESDTASRSFDRMSKSLGGFRQVLGGMLTSQLITRGIGLMSMGIRGVASEFVDFDHSLTAASAKFPEKIRRGTREFDELAKAARTVGAQTQFTATEAAEGLNFLAMAGFNAQQAMAALPGVVDLATAANMDLGRSTDIASDALGAFGLMTKDATQLSKNLTRINDVFAKTVTTSNTDLEMLFETMKESGPSVAGAGGDVETFAALLGTMASSGVKASKAGTTLKNMYLRLAAPPAEARKQLAKLNIITQDSSGNMLDMVNILGQIAYATRDMGTAQKSAALDAIFSKRAINGANVVIEAGHDALTQYRDQLYAAGGASTDMANQMRTSFKNRFAEIKSAAIEVGLRFFDVFQEKIPNFMDTVVNAIRKVDVNEIVEDVKAFWEFLKKIFSVFQALSPIIIGVVAAMASYKLAMVAIMAVQIVQSIMAFTTALGAAATAQGILNAVMMANPILALVTLIGLLVAAGVALYQNWDEIAKGLELQWKAIMVSFEKYILPILEALGILTKGEAKKLQLAIELKRHGVDVFEEVEKGKVRRMTDEFFPPNASIEEARREQMQVTGKMTFVNPPKGMEFESDFFAPEISRDSLGAN